MATALEMDLEQPTSTGIVALVEANPVMVLTDRQKFSQFYDEIKKETDKLIPDVSTERGRKKIASMAHKVARTKTAIDDAGKKLNEEARARINAIDESRREIRQQLDALKEEVRRPLTDWEVAEERRVDECKKTLQLLRDSASVGYEETADDVRKRLVHVESLAFDPVEFDGYLPRATELREQTIDALTSAIARLDREEAERAELERLRAEAAERERVEQERIAAEQEAERQRQAEQAERERVERLKAEAAEAALREAERKAAEEREAAERAHAEALAAEKRRADEAEAARQAEADRTAREERERKAAAAREAEEQARRERDRAHRGKIMGEAKAAIMECGVDEPIAKTIVLAIVGGNVPHVRMEF